MFDAVVTALLRAVVDEILALMCRPTKRGRKRSLPPKLSRPPQRVSWTPTIRGLLGARHFCQHLRCGIRSTGPTRGWRTSIISHASAYPVLTEHSKEWKSIIRQRLEAATAFRREMWSAAPGQDPRPWRARLKENVYGLVIPCRSIARSVIFPWPEPGLPPVTELTSQPLRNTAATNTPAPCAIFPLPVPRLSFPTW